LFKGAADNARMESIAPASSIPLSADGERQIADLLRRMPAAVARTFTREQLAALEDAVATRTWGRHPLDIRGSIPWGKHRYFFAMLAGRNRRDMSAQEKALDNAFAILLFSGFLSFCAVCGFVALYLIKSALDIDIFADYSLGLWTCVQQNVL
jgi:hypothetical protein